VLNHAVLNLSLERAGAVRRFCNALSLLFELSNIHPDDWALHGRTYLDGTAADYIHTAMHALPKVERTWAAFCALLGTRFGQIDPRTQCQGHEWVSEGVSE
jgi:hypothetical protein